MRLSESLAVVRPAQGVESAEKTGAAARKAADRDTADMEAFLQVRQRSVVPLCLLTGQRSVYHTALVTLMLSRLPIPIVALE